MEESNDFLGCNIEFLKKVTTPKPEGGKRIVVSTSYFLSYLYDFPKVGKTPFYYLNELINNIETFKLKYNEFTRPGNQWIYRVYIDKTIFDPIINFDYDNAVKQIRFDDNNIYQITITELDDTIKSLQNLASNFYKIDFIKEFMTKYIKHICESKLPKYENIEICTYYNDNLVLKIHENKYITKITSDKDIVISGHKDTFGTILRMHPLVCDDVDVCIMRNCSHNFTPLDMLIQDYWIHYTNYVYMTYETPMYHFGNRNNLKKIFKIRNQNGHNLSNNIRFDFNNPHQYISRTRNFAGLSSCRITPETRDEYKKLLADLFNDYIKPSYIEDDSMKYYSYGIDE